MFILVHNITGKIHSIPTQVKVTDGALILWPAQSHPRSGWEEAFATAAEADYMPANDLFDSIGNVFDQTDWQW